MRPGKYIQVTFKCWVISAGTVTKHTHVCATEFSFLVTYTLLPFVFLLVHKWII